LLLQGKIGGNMVDYDDLDQNLKRKEELVEKAKELSESDDLNAASKQFAALRKEWKRFEDYESNFEEQLRDKFEEYANIVKTKKDELSANAVENKEALIEKAKEISNLSSFKEASKKMEEVMADWKKSVSAGKEKDDELWAQFKTARDAFYDKKKEYYKNLNEKFAASKATKEEIIAKAQELASSTEWKKTTTAIEDLLEQWKAAGSAGRTTDDELWKQFSAARKQFNSAKNQYYSKLKETFAERATQKEELIAEAKKCVAQSNFSEEMVKKVKGLRTKWKEIGNCGRAKEDSLWNEFNDTINLFFKNLRDNNKY
jgi:chromosome segregation ATPase